jgi:hypothetical protein
MIRILFLVFLLHVQFSFSQSKKEQIESLNGTIDSLTTVLQTTRYNASHQVTVLNTTIDSLNTAISELKSGLSELRSSIAILEKDNAILTLEKKKFKTDLDDLNKKNSIEISYDTFKINEGDYAGETKELPVIKVKNNPKLEKSINEEIFLRLNLLQTDKFDPIFGFEKFVSNANSEFREISTLWYFFEYSIYNSGEGKFIVEFFGRNFELIRYFLSIENDSYELNFDRRFLDDPDREH